MGAGDHFTDHQADGQAAVGARKAVALGYRPEKHEAPVIKAKGSGHIAEQIVQTALAHGVPVQKDADLATLLSNVDLDTTIPVEAFVAVAEILSFLYRLNGLPDGLDGDAHEATTGVHS